MRWRNARRPAAIAHPPALSHMKLNLLIAGAQKGGTSALHYFLSQHPQICMSREKELMLFNREQLSLHDLSISEADFPAKPSPKYYGESTPYYMCEPEVLRRIRTYNPGVKLIVVLRNPLDRLLSQYAMNVRACSKLLPIWAYFLSDPILYRFAWLLREAQIPARWRCRLVRNMNYRLDGPAGLNSFPAVLRARNYISRGFYDRHLKHIYRLFPRQNVICITTDDLEQRHHQTLRRIFELLDVDPDVRINQDRINRRDSAAPRLPAMWECYVRWRFLRHTRALEQLLGRNLPESWKNGIRN